MKTVLIDYAYPCMMAEKALKRLHDAMLEKRWDDAIMDGLDAIEQARLTVIAVSDMKKEEQKNKSLAMTLDARDL